MIDLKSEQLSLIKKILHRHVPERTIWVFGSRVDGTSKEYSDLDIAIIGTGPLPTKIFSNLKEDFAKSDLPFQVDVVDWNRISPEFQKIIKKKYVALDVLF